MWPRSLNSQSFHALKARTQWLSIWARDPAMSWKLWGIAQCPAKTNAGEFVLPKQQMDSQFNTLSQSYRDNYLQYSATGNEKFKKAYVSAQKGLDDIIASMQEQVNTANDSLHEAVGQDAAQRYTNNQEELRRIGVDIHREDDRIEQGKLRQMPKLTSDYTIQYVLIVLLLGAVTALNVL